MASDDLSVHSTRVGLQMSAELVGAPWWDTANGTVGCRVLPVEQVSQGRFSGGGRVSEATGRDLDLGRCKGLIHAEAAFLER